MGTSGGSGAAGVHTGERVSGVLISRAFSLSAVAVHELRANAPPPPPAPEAALAIGSAVATNAAGMGDALGGSGGEIHVLRLSQVLHLPFRQVRKPYCR